MNKQHIFGAITLGLCLLAVFFGHEQTKPLDAFDQWKLDNKPSWGPETELYRRMIFEKNVEKINLHNADPTKTYEMGINQFTAYTQEEFISNFLGAVVPIEEVAEIVDEVYEPTNDIDWTQKGGVTRVKNQGQCGSCWAFSAVGAIESAYKVQKSQTVDLSEQQLVDCTRSMGNQGCNGGWPSRALTWVKNNGITSESAYPYTAKDGSCKTSSGSTKISGTSTNSGCNGLTSGINTEPISVTVDASNWSSYKTGVMSNCGKSINHAVLLVGIVGGNWKIKNSWGTGWGEQGFIRLASGNTCGVCSQAGVSVKA